jgi:hypothetical protein
MYKFPYGVSNFIKLREQGYLYLDRTYKLKQLEDISDTILFLRPRRFGKTLLLSTLEACYDLRFKEKYKSLFKGLYIEKNPLEKRNQYMILKFDFSNVSVSGKFEAILRDFHDYVNSCCKEFLDKYEEYLTQKLVISEERSLSNLRELLRISQISKFKIYVLIDEYDNFMNELMIGRKQEYENLATGEGIVKTFFKILKSHCGSSIDRIFMTGVSPILLTDISSGFNISMDISLHPQFNELCGFKEEEIEEILRKILVEADRINEKKEILDKIRHFYNGYRFSIRAAEKIYNPTLSLYFFNHFQEFGEFPDEMLDANLAPDMSKLDFISKRDRGKGLIYKALEEGEVRISRLINKFNLKELITLEKKDEKYLASYLYYFGMLTIKTKEFKFHLTIPNNVIKRLFFERLKIIFLGDENLSLEESETRLFKERDIEWICRFMENNVLKAMSNRDYISMNELGYKIMFLSLFYNEDLYQIYSEQEVKRGYPDLFFCLKREAEKYGLGHLLLEFKYISLKELKMSGDEIGESKVEDLWDLEAIKKKEDEAKVQLERYAKELREKYDYGDMDCYVIIGIGFDRVLGKKVL